MWFGFLFLAISTIALSSSAQESPSSKLTISFDQAQELGARIWKNECAGKIEGLTTWNEREDFASLGIGHFIWYPPQSKKNYQETFPSLLEFLETCGASAPKWLDSKAGCPWRNKHHFTREINSVKMEELRQFLFDTKALQAVFIAKRLEDALPKMTRKLEITERRKVQKHFYALAKTQKGLYALIDYLNFKGEGTAEQEKYGNKGWGLLQVLQRIPENSILQREDFVKAAKEVLTERVKNSPHEKQEKKWLKGWIARVQTYLD